MPRQRLFYVVYEMGRAVRIAHGHAEALKAHSAWSPFKTREAAEEAASWVNYHKDREEERQDEARRQKKAERG